MKLKTCVCSCWHEGEHFCPFWSEQTHVPRSHAESHTVVGAEGWNEEPWCPPLELPLPHLWAHASPHCCPSLPHIRPHGCTGQLPANSPRPEPSRATSPSRHGRAAMLWWSALGLRRGRAQGHQHGMSHPLVPAPGFIQARRWGEAAASLAWPG